jgi:hypothetical protein
MENITSRENVNSVIVGMQKVSFGYNYSGV